MTNPIRPNRRRWWLIGAALAVGLAGFGHLLSVAIRGDAETAGDRPIGSQSVRTVVAFGLVDAEAGVCKMSATFPGVVVSEVLVKQGEHVPAGAILLRFDDTVARKDLDKANAAVEGITAARERGKTLPEQHRYGLAQAEAAVKAAEAQRNMAREELKKTEKLQGVNASQETLAIAREQLRAADEGLLSKKAELARLRLQDPKAEMQGLESQVKQAVAARESAEAALKQYTLVAPKAGTVLQITVGAGDTVGGSTPLPAIQFCPDGPRVVKADVDQASASLVRVDQRVTIEDDTHAPGKWTGHVKWVADWFANQRPVMQPDLGQFNDVRTMPCWIELDPGQAPLRINQRVIVTIEVPVK